MILNRHTPDPALVRIGFWKRSVRAYAAAALLLAVLFAAPVRALPADAVTVPIQLHGVHIFVEIAINGKPATFVVDTGASANVITPQAVKRLHLMPGDEQTPVT